MCNSEFLVCLEKPEDLSSYSHAEPWVGWEQACPVPRPPSGSIPAWCCCHYKRLASLSSVTCLSIPTRHLTCDLAV